MDKKFHPHNYHAEMKAVQVFEKVILDLIKKKKKKKKKVSKGFDWRVKVYTNPFSRVSREPEAWLTQRGGWIEEP